MSHLLFFFLAVHCFSIVAGMPSRVFGEAFGIERKLAVEKLYVLAGSFSSLSVSKGGA
jgi:hypothetical protein